MTLAEETETSDAAPSADVEKADAPIGQLDEPCDTPPVSGHDGDLWRPGVFRQPTVLDGAILFGSPRVAREGSYACDSASGSKRNLTLDGCPFCGLRDLESDQTGISGLHKIPYLGRLLGDTRWSSNCRAGEPRLRPGETAGSLLEIRERLGPGVLAGTTFGEQCAGEVVKLRSMEVTFRTPGTDGQQRFKGMPWHKQASSSWKFTYSVPDPATAFMVELIQGGTPLQPQLNGVLDVIDVPRVIYGQI